MLARMVGVARKTNADVLVCDYYLDDATGSMRETQEQGFGNSPAALLECILTGRCHGSLWNKLIRRKCFETYHIGFAEGLNLYEDELVCTRLLVHPEIKVAYLPEAFYHYDREVNPASITRHYTRSTYLQERRFLKELNATVTDGRRALHARQTVIAYNALVHGVTSRKEYEADFKADAKKMWNSGRNIKERALTVLAARGGFFIVQGLLKVRHCLER